jgi:hypothetical protein
VVEHLEERVPVPSLVRGDVERPVLALPRAGRREADRHGPRQRHAFDVVTVEREVARRGNFVCRQIDRLPADLVAVAQRGEDRNGGVRARLVPVLLSRDRHRRTFGPPHAVHAPARGVGHEVRRTPVAVRAGQPERRDRAHHGIVTGPREREVVAVEPGERLPAGG